MKIGQPPVIPPAATASPSPAREPGQKGITLSQGQIVRALVLGSNSDGSYLLDVNGQRLTARSAISLPINEHLWLEVKGNGVPPWLGLAPQARAAGQELLLLIAGNLGGEQPPPAMVAELLALLPGTALADRLAQLADRLRLFTSNADASLERVLRTLIAFQPGHPPSIDSLLKEISGLLDQARQLPAAANARDVFRRLDQFIGLAETLTAMNGAEPPAGYYIYPAFFDDGGGRGQWTMAAASDRLQLDFFLQMSNLGDLHAGFLIRDDRIDGSFTVADPAAAAHIAKGLPLLEVRLGALGFSAVSLVSRDQEVRLLQRVRDRLLPENRGEQAGLINITA